MKIGITQLQVLWNMLKLKQAGISFGSGLRIRGWIGLSNLGVCTIGRNYVNFSGNMTNAMGRNVKSYIKVGENACLTIGDNVGMSSTCIWCDKEIKIDDYVTIGALTIITDSDAHSIDPKIRLKSNMGNDGAKLAPVHIGRNVFIGTSCIICKGVTIGENSVLGAGSVLTKNIPSNELWAGNPARFIKKIV